MERFTTQYKILLPSSPVRTAIAYSLERWERLCHYTKDGMLNPDNNPVERQIRPVTVGRGTIYSPAVIRVLSAWL